MRMQVILDSLFGCLGSVPIWGGKKGEFMDWTILNNDYMICPMHSYKYLKMSFAVALLLKM